MTILVGLDDSTHPTFYVLTDGYTKGSRLESIQSEIPNHLEDHLADRCDARDSQGSVTCRDRTTRCVTAGKVSKRNFFREPAFISPQSRVFSTS